MGSDDLHKKRKHREAHSYKRQVAEREQYTRILIVCEGETERAYLQALADDHDLHRGRIKIIDCPGASDPLNIANHTIEEMNNGDFDHAYCVFDGIGNTNINEAKTLISKSDKIDDIVSYPCFEYWLFMHYTNSTSPISDDANMLRKLKSHIKGYQKPMKNSYDITKHKLNTALQNSKSTLSQAKSLGEPNPSTALHILVQELIKISEQEQ